VTFYDLASGERVELSATTVDNWVSKIANLFADELSLEPGDGVRVALPVHWQTAVTLLGAWTAGLHVLLDDTGEAAATVTGPAALGAAHGLPGQVVACSLRPLGAPFTSPLPAGWLDFALAVPSQPDALVYPSSAGADDIAMVSQAGEVSHGELALAAASTADRLSLVPGSRLLTDANPADPDGVLTALAAPLIAGGSVVLVNNGDEAGHSAIAEQERVTVTALAPRRPPLRDT
jgi:uncharacterized protein (TIGR03089 family)